MKKCLLFCLFLSLFQYASATSSMSGWYAGVTSSSTWINQYRIGESYNISGNVGYRFSCFRAEGEITSRQHSKYKAHGTLKENETNIYTDLSVQEKKIESVAYMGNLIFDLPMSCFSITPYVGAGTGHVKITREEKLRGSEEYFHTQRNYSGIGYQLFTGASYPLFYDTEISLEYKYFQGAKTFYRNQSVGCSLNRFF